MTGQPKRRSEETAIEIRETEREYDRFVKERRRAIEILQKEYETIVSKAGEKPKKLKYDTIKEAGFILERLLKDKTRISAKLKRDFKDVIHRSVVYQVCKDLNRAWQHPRREGWGNQYKNKRSGSAQIEHEKSASLTPEEKRYLEAHQRETIRNELIDKIVQEWTGVNKNQIPDVLSRTEKGKHWAQTLLKESTNYMRDICFKMTMSALHGTLEDLRILEILRAGFSELALEVYEQRKKTEQLDSP